MILSCESQSAESNNSFEDTKVNTIHDLQFPENIGTSRQCKEYCLTLGDSSEYKLKIQFSNSSGQEVVFAMNQRVQFDSKNLDLLIEMDSFATTLSMYSHELFINFLNQVKLKYFVAENGFEITNKGEVWDVLLNQLPPESKERMLEEASGNEAAFTTLGPMGQILQFTSPIIQIHNVQYSDEDTISWYGYLHGEYYGYNNTLFPCQFELLHFEEEKFLLITKVNVDSLREELGKIDANNEILERMSNESVIASVSVINGVGVDRFEWNLPRLLPDIPHIIYLYKKLN